jgi:hypothetical protein
MHAFGEAKTGQTAPGCQMNAFIEDVTSFAVKPPDRLVDFLLIRTATHPWLCEHPYDYNRLEAREPAGVRNRGGGDAV